MKFSAQLEQTFELLRQIDENGQPSDQIARGFFRSRHYLGSHDRHVVSETAFGMIRSKRRIETLFADYMRQHSLSLPPNTLAARYLPLYVAFTVAVIETPLGELMPLVGPMWDGMNSGIGLDRYSEWILKHSMPARFGEDEKKRLAVLYSFQDWMVEEWYAEYGNATEDVLRSLNVPAPTAIRVNLSKCSREECRSRLQAEGITTSLCRFSPVGLVCEKRFNREASKAFRDGWFEFQDEASQLVSLVAAPTSGMCVVDACAGGGGKSLHLADLMKNSGEVIALDPDERHLAELRTRSRRAGTGIIRTTPLAQADRARLEARADIVLVDAPCSGVGTIRRNPWRKWFVTQSSLLEFAREQARILEYNEKFVKAGGRLVYVTCSLFRRENEDVVEAFLKSHKDFIPDLGPEKSKQLGLEPENGVVKLLPCRHGTDGFFIATLKRAG